MQDGAVERDWQVTMARPVLATVQDKLMGVCWSVQEREKM